MLEVYQEKWDAFAASKAGQGILKAARWLFFAAILGYLYLELSRIGWLEIARSLPTQPLFYILFLLLYVSLPVAEVFIYKQSWKISFFDSLPAFFKKRVYNRDVLGYSGELYFYSWARGRVGVSDGDIARTVRDNNILSSVASTGVAVVLLIVFLVYGEVSFSTLFGTDWTVPALVVAVTLAILTPIAIRFRRYLFSMPIRLALVILGIQCARLLIGQVLQIGQWAVVMPEVPLNVWFTFAAVSILLTRIPFLPNQNLIFLGAGIEMSAYLEVSTATLAGTLLITNVLDKTLNVAVLGLLNAQRAGVKEEETPPKPPSGHD